MNERTLPYELIFTERPHYLYARLTAQSTDAPTAIEYVTAMIMKCRELKGCRLLIEHITQSGLSTVDTFRAASEIAKIGVHDIKIAFVDADLKFYETYQFGALVAINRGLKAKV